MLVTRALPVSWRLIFSAGNIIGLTLILSSLHTTVQDATASLLYLLVVLISAIGFGLWPGLLASVLAFLLFNFFFVTPSLAFGVTNTQDAIRLGTFLVVAFLASSLAGRVSTEAERATRRAAELDALYSLSQTISAEVALDRILPRIARTAETLLEIPECRMLLRNADGQLTTTTQAAVVQARMGYEDIPLRAGERDLGIIRIACPERGDSLPPDKRTLLDMIANQVILVLERARLAEEAGHVQALAESDRLKSTLLTSVSHDLRTPLALIKGAATNLLSADVSWDGESRQQFLTTIDQEADRLNRLVGELLEMSRIEAGTLQQTRSRHDLGELIEHVAARLGSRFKHHRIELDLPADLPPVLINYAQIDQVLTNLLENAATYAPPDTPITIRARALLSQVEVAVLDRGPGIPGGMIDRIFDKFVRAAGPERHAEGIGLGLAICKGLIEAHGGTITARNRPDGGAAFTWTLPRTAVAHHAVMAPVALLES